MKALIATMAGEGLGHKSAPVMVHTLISKVVGQGLGRNAVLAMMQALIVMICLFLSYRVLIAQEGIAALGLWSLLMIFAGVAGAFDISGVSALTRFVARHDIEFPGADRAQLLHTVLLTGMAINGAMLALLLWAAPWALPLLVSAHELAEARALIVWVAILMLVNPLALGVTTSLDGLMRADIRAVLVSIAAVLGLVVSWMSIHRFGIVGLPIGLLVQQTIIVCGGWLILRRFIVRLSWLPWRWNFTIFKATTGYALRLNLVGVLSLLLEPLTRICLNTVGGTAAVGLYDLAARLAVQLRSIVVSATAPLMATFAASEKPDSPETQAPLYQSERLVSMAALAIALLSTLGAPLLSIAMLGEISTGLMAMNAMLAFGWSLNLVSVPWNLLAQAYGRMRWIILAQALVGVCIIGVVLIVPDPSQLVVTSGVALGLTMSAIVTIAGNAFHFKLWDALRRQASIISLAVFMIGIITSIALLLAIKLQ